MEGPLVRPDRYPDDPVRCGEGEGGGEEAKVSTLSNRAGSRSKIGIRQRVRCNRRPVGTDAASGTWGASSVMVSPENGIGLDRARGNVAED